MCIFYNAFPKYVFIRTSTYWHLFFPGVVYGCVPGTIIVIFGCKWYGMASHSSLVRFPFVLVCAPKYIKYCDPRILSYIFFMWKRHKQQPAVEQVKTNWGLFPDLPQLKAPYDVLVALEKTLPGGHNPQGQQGITRTIQVTYLVLFLVSFHWDESRRFFVSYPVLWPRARFQGN